MLTSPRTQLLTISLKEQAVSDEAETAARYISGLGVIRGPYYL